jgi:hypothetical protein
MTMLKLIRQFFTNECRLISLRLDITCYRPQLDLHRCLKPAGNISTNSTLEEYQPYCLTLRHLHIHLKHSCFLEHLIEHVPLLEELSVYFEDSLSIWPRSKVEIETLIQTSGNWFDKVRLKENYEINCLCD